MYGLDGIVGQNRWKSKDKVDIVLDENEDWVVTVQRLKNLGLKDVTLDTKSGVASGTWTDPIGKLKIVGVASADYKDMFYGYDYD